MIVLALDTALSQVGLALIQSQKILASGHLPNRQISESLMPLLVQLFQKAALDFSDVTHVIYGQGPGSFTSLRMGLATLLGLFMATEQSVEWAGVSSLKLRALSLNPELNPGDLFYFKARLNKFYTGFLDPQKGWQENCLSSQQLEELALKKNLIQHFNLAESDPFIPEAFLRLSPKDLDFKASLKALSLNYLQPIEDIATRSFN